MQYSNLAGYWVQPLIEINHTEATDHSELVYIFVELNRWTASYEAKPAVYKPALEGRKVL